MKILMASKKEIKIEGAKEAFSQYFSGVDIEGIAVPSGVSEQPLNDEIYQGAQNRLAALMEYAKENNLSADYYLSVESGLINNWDKWFNVSLAIIADKEGNIGYGMSSAYPVPKKYVEEISNSDLSSFYENHFGSNEGGVSKSKGSGGVHIITQGKVNRKSLIKEAFTMALTEFINGGMWRE